MNKYSDVIKNFKYSGKKSFLRIIMMSFLKIKSKGFSRRHHYNFFFWFRMFTKSLFVSLFSLYKEKEKQIMTLLNTQFFGSQQYQCVSSFIEPINLKMSKVLFSFLKKAKQAKIMLSKILWSKYSFKAFFVGSKKLITLLRSPHTDKKARDQFYRKDFSSMGFYPKFFSKQYTYLYKNLFKRNKFLWSSVEQIH